MHRRLFLGALMTSALAAITPASAEVFVPRCKIIWEDGARESPHAELVLTWINKCIDDQAVICRYTEWDMGINPAVKLFNPTFVVDVSTKLVWNYITGFTNEPSPRIRIYENDIFITETAVGSSVGRNEYFKHLKTDQPDYFVRIPSMSYEEEKILEAKLPKGQFYYDDTHLKLTLKYVADINAGRYAV